MQAPHASRIGLRMALDDPALIAWLRAGTPDPLPSGLSAAALAEARDAYLHRQAAPRDETIAGAVHRGVEIRRDPAGVPHVFAATTPDLFFGLGVATAQDRLWQIDRLRRRALGRQAEIMGSGYLSQDIAHLTIGIDEIATREAAAMDDTTRAIVAAFVAGINRWIETTRHRLPIEFTLLDYEPEPFTERDVVAIGRGIWWSLNGRIDRLAAAEAARLLPTEPLRKLYLTPEASENLVAPDWPGARAGGGASGTDDATGSNNWALAAELTGTGRAMLCGDPHQPFWVPSSWYEFALHGPEDHAAGAGHPGLPGLWWGSNGTTAWAITNNAASTRDLYREQVHPDDPGRYREAGGWRRFGERHLTIPVRGADPHALTIRATERGPIVNHLLTGVDPADDPPLSLRWVGAEHLDDMRAMIALSRARDWQGFRAALRDWAIAVFNFTYSDAAGHIGYQMAGRIPRRGRITAGFRDADNLADRWDGYIPFDALPRSIDPARGYVASANQRIVPPNEALPLYGAYSQGHRGVRIDQAFSGGASFDRAANIRFQNDVKNCRAERLCPHIVRHLDGASDSDAALVAATLRGWDYGYDQASIAATLFETFMALWQRTVLAQHIPARLIDLTMQQTGLAAGLLEGEAPAYFPDGTTATVRRVAGQATALLRERLGTEQSDWGWGRVHLAHWRHPLSSPPLAPAFDIGPAPIDGGSHTIRNTGGELPPHAATSGAEYRIVVDFTTPDRFLAVQNIGNSGVPGSPHYRDQFEHWLWGKYHTVHLTEAAVAADTSTTTRIEPVD
jgi:penicillin amidase